MYVLMSVGDKQAPFDLQSEANELFSGHAIAQRRWGPRSSHFATGRPLADGLHNMYVDLPGGTAEDMHAR